MDSTNGCQEDLDIDICGPSVLWGVVLQLPYISLKIAVDEIMPFNTILPNYWILKEKSHTLKLDKTSIKSYFNTYHHPELKNFNLIWDDLWLDTLEEFDLSEETVETIYQNNLWKKVNDFFTSQLPLSESFRQLQVQTLG